MNFPLLLAQWRLSSLLLVLVALGLSASDIVPSKDLPSTNTTAAASDSPSKPSQASYSRSRSRIAFALVGIASYGTQRVALFDGSDSVFKQMLHTGEKIGSFTLVAIDADHVDLQSQTNLIRLSLLQEMRQEGIGDWQILDLSTPFTPSNTRPTSAMASSARRSEPTSSRGTADRRTDRTSNGDSARPAGTQEISRTDRAALSAGGSGSSSRQRSDDSSRRQSRRTERSNRSQQ